MAADTQVCIVDDDREVLDALSWLLRSRNLTSLPFSSGEAFLEWFELQPAVTAYVRVVLLDVRMPGVSGLQVFDRLKEVGTLATMPVIFLTGHGDVPMAVEMIKQGAFDFVEKPFNDNALVDRVEQGLIHARGQMTSGLSAAQVRVRLASLTEREQEVMRLILEGRLNKVVADTLGISVRTVEVHRARVFEKMGVKSAVELARLINDGKQEKN